MPAADSDIGELIFVYGLFIEKAMKHANGPSVIRLMELRCKWGWAGCDTVVPLVILHPTVENGEVEHGCDRSVRCINRTNLIPQVLFC